MGCDLETWLWSPLGRHGAAAVVEQLSLYERCVSLPGPMRQQHRASFVLGGREISVDWRGEPLVASVDGTEVVFSRVRPGKGAGTFVWPYTLSSTRVLEEAVEMERGEVDRGRLRGRLAPWELAVTGPHGRRWSWTAAGRGVYADRMELRRVGDTEPVVVHDLRPVPGRPRRARDTVPEVRWTPSATPAEVMLDALWVLEVVYEGILPKIQRVARADVL